MEDNANHDPVVEEILSVMSDTFDGNERLPHVQLWDLVDRAFDDGAKCEGLLGGLEHLYEAVEDYCKHASITSIPRLYASIFAVRGGFLTQSKMSLHMADEWNARFPTPLRWDPFPHRDHPEIVAFRRWMVDQGRSHTGALHLFDVYAK